MNEFGAEIDRHVERRQRLRQDASADAVAGFESDHMRGSRGELQCRRQTRGTRTDDDDIRIHIEERLRASA